MKIRILRPWVTPGICCSEEAKNFVTGSCVDLGLEVVWEGWSDGDERCPMEGR
jgi:hypothetical protein